MFGTKIYTVHIKPGMTSAASRPVFIKEGFTFWGFFFTILWALYQRLWLVALLLLTFNALLVVCLKNHVLGLASIGVLHFGLHMVVGFWGNDWLRSRLARRGYVLADIAAGDNLLRAEQRYFERMLAAA